MANPSKLSHQFLLCTMLLLSSTVFAPALAQEAAPAPPPRPEALENGKEDTPAATPDSPTSKAVEPSAANATPGKPQPVTINARISEDGDIIPQGLVWRVYSTTPNESGELDLLDKSNDSAAIFSLSPGEYVVHVAYGRAQASDTITVEPGPNQLQMILDVGGLELDAAISGEIPIPDRFVRFSVHSLDANGQPFLVARAVAPGQTLHLNSGTYSVTSFFGSVNATAKADLQVKAGQLTAATLYHRAAQVTFKLVSEPGGEAIADTSWLVKTMAGETVYDEATAFPATVLAEGEYILIARLGDRVFNREFEIIPGLPREIEILAN